MPRKPRQVTIPGTAAKSLKDIDDAAEHYVAIRDERMEFTKQEVQAQAALLAAMNAHGLKDYRDDNADPPLVVTLTEPGIKAKVKKCTPDNPNGDSDEE